MSHHSKNLLGVAAVLSLGGLFAFACSTSTSSVSAAQACADVAAARCQVEQQCDPQAILTAYGDLSTCESTQSSTCLLNLAAPDTANTPAHTEGCAQATPTQSCDDYALGIVPAACNPPTGPRDAGSDCALSGQCSTAYCLVPRTATCGTCAEAPGLGTSCFNNACGPGYLCDNLSYQCVAPVAAAGACSNSSVCGPGLTCLGNGADGGTLGSCVALATLGGNCDLTDGGSRCDGRFGLDCNTEAGKVCAQAATATATQPCGTIDGGAVDCVADSFCQKAPSDKEGTCVASSPQGGACDTANGPGCTPPARCVLADAGVTAGICQAPNYQACN